MSKENETATDQTELLTGLRDIAENMDSTLPTSSRL